MIYFLSDQHGGECVCGMQEYFDKGGEDDLLIILGDIGIKFQDTEENRKFDEMIMSSKKKIAFIDGNHENFKYIYSFPVEDWNGGQVHRLTDNVVHLMRGNIYTIQGKTFFAFGGCKSSEKWKTMGLWQPEEAPTDEEIALAYENLKNHGNKVDYILTHKYEGDRIMGTKALFDLCLYIDEKVDFKFWYAGHWHFNKRINDKHMFVYDELVALE